MATTGGTTEEDIRKEEAAAISRVRAEHAIAKDFLADMNEQLDSGSGRLIVDIRKAFEKDKDLSPAQRSAAYIDSSNFLKASEFVRKNSGTALMVIGSAVAIVGVSSVGALPVVLAVVATGTGAVGAAQVALGSLTRTTAMLPIIKEQQTKVYKAGLKKLEQAKKDEALAVVEERYNKLPLQIELRAIDKRTGQLTNEILRLEKRKLIIAAIDDILEMKALSDVNEKLESNGEDFGRFEQFKKDQEKKLKALDELIGSARESDSTIFKNKEYARIHSFNAFKAHLVEMRRDLVDTRSKAQIKSKEDILKKIDEIRKSLKPPGTQETPSEKAAREKEFNALGLLLDRARQLDVQFQFSTERVKLVDLNNIPSLKTYLDAIERYTKDIEKEKGQEELTVLQQALASTVEKRQQITREHKDALDKQIKAFEEVLPLVEQRMRETVTLAQWTQQVQVSIDNWMAKVSPTALSVLQSGRVFTEAMEASFSSSYTIPTGTLADINSKAEKAKETASEAAAAEVSTKGAEAIAWAAKASAEVPRASVNSIVTAVSTAIAAQTLSDTAGAEGAKAVGEAVIAASKVKDATVNSVAAAAIAAFELVQARAGEISAHSKVAAADFKRVQEQLSVSDIKRLETLLPDVKAGIEAGSIIFATAAKVLQQSTENNDIRFLDLLRIEDVCSKDPHFAEKTRTFLSSPEGLFKPNPEFKVIIEKLTAGHQLKNVMLKIMKVNANMDKVPSLAGDSASQTISNITKALSEINTDLLSVNEELDKQLGVLQIYFPPDDNANKKRFIFVADKEQAAFFKKALKLKKDLISVNKTLKELNSAQLEAIKKDADLNKKLDELVSTAKTIEESIQKQVKKIENREKINEGYRKPYVSVFSGVADPIKELHVCMQKANFPDVLLLLTEANLKEFVKFAMEPGRGVTTELAKEFCELYAYGVDGAKPEIEAKRLNFLKKIRNLSDANDNQKGLEELKGLYQMYLKNSRQSLNYTDLKKINGEAFKSENDFAEYIKNNEQCYHTQRILGVQELAVVESMRRDLKGELNLLNRQLDRSETVDSALTVHLAVEPPAPAEQPVESPAVQIHVKGEPKPLLYGHGLHKHKTDLEQHKTPSSVEHNTHDDKHKKSGL